MDDTELLEHLFELARDAGLVVRIHGAGSAADTGLASGVCRVRDEVWVVLSREEPASVHVDVLCQALRTEAGDFLEGRFVPPAVRDRIDAG